MGNITVIPAKRQVGNNITLEEKPKLRVAAYCRVSTEAEEQQNSYQVQIEYYTNYINSNPEWTLAGIFADEGISGTGTAKRTEFNKRILKIASADEVDEINPDGGFVKYGLVKNDYVLVKGSLPGPSKRLVILRQPIRPNNKAEDIPQINYISTKSKQGV